MLALGALEEAEPSRLEKLSEPVGFAVEDRLALPSDPVVCVFAAKGEALRGIELIVANVGRTCCCFAVWG